MAASSLSSEKTNPGDPANNLRDAVSSEIQSLRDHHQVKLIEGKDEGFPIAALPNGVYGFTYSPQEAAPVFSMKMFQIFEVHKTAIGNVHILGFITEDDAQKLFTKIDEFVSIELYPDPHENAVKAISLPKSHILEHRGPTRENGNALKLKVEPFSNPIE